MNSQEAATYYGTGKRKTSVAKVWLFPGSGKIEVNGRDFKQVFPRLLHQNDVVAPLKAVNMIDKMDVRAETSGGGITGQVGSIQLGIARALLKMDESYRPLLTQQSLLTRDPRMKERKKYGQPGARKRFQYSKR
ncbi:MAG: 30S ribosomal protein S9 [bacterium]